jgi:hypothetical protein
VIDLPAKPDPLLVEWWFANAFSFAAQEVRMNSMAASSSFLEVG